MKPKEKKPETVFRIIDKVSGEQSVVIVGLTVMNLILIA